MTDTRIEVTGADRLAATVREQVAQGLKEGLSAAGLILQREAQKRAPVDRGELRKGIYWKLSSDTAVEVGSRAKHTPWMEYGTGLLNDHPSWPKQRHAPPVGALAGWAKRKGVSAGAVAAAIARRGGLKPRRFLRGALEDNQAKVVKIVAASVRKATGG